FQVRGQLRQGPQRTPRPLRRPRNPRSPRPVLLVRQGPFRNRLARALPALFFVTGLSSNLQDRVMSVRCHCAMNTTPRTALLALAVALALAACKPSDPSATAAGAPAPAGTGVTAGDEIAAQITGAGSTFFFPLVSRWSADYNASTGHKVNYQSIGSGGGIAQIKAGTVAFGASDAPLSSAELDEAGLLQFPVVIGGVVPVVNLTGI